MITLEKIPVPNPSVVARLINNEAVLVLPARGQVKVLNEVGARIWSLMDGTRTVGDIVTTIRSEYTVSAEDALSDISDFFMQLLDREIISLVERR
jgi:hypothetical protein